jgi:hypothetical protein
MFVRRPEVEFNPDFKLNFLPLAFVVAAASTGIGSLTKAVGLVFLTFSVAFRVASPKSRSLSMSLKPVHKSYVDFFSGMKGCS